jgi:hypothetical protein
MFLSSTSYDAGIRITMQIKILVITIYCFAGVGACFADYVSPYSFRSRKSFLLRETSM